MKQDYRGRQQFDDCRCQSNNLIVIVVGTGFNELLVEFLKVLPSGCPEELSRHDRKAIQRSFGVKRMWNDIQKIDVTKASKANTCGGYLHATNIADHVRVVFARVHTTCTLVIVNWTKDALIVQRTFNVVEVCLRLASLFSHRAE